MSSVVQISPLLIRRLSQFQPLISMGIISCLSYCNTVKIKNEYCTCEAPGWIFTQLSESPCRTQPTLCMDFKNIILYNIILAH